VIEVLVDRRVAARIHHDGSVVVATRGRTLTTA
jgi:hypothetical protein